MATREGVLKELFSLLYWTMLAACTVGPGTVVTCARAGAEYQLTLIWALIFASLLAYILQEGTARLTITSGRSLGQCLQLKYNKGKLFWDVGIICWVVAASVFVGNTLYECNNWAGGMAAIYSLPGAENTHGLRISCCIAYGVVVFGILFADKVNSLGVALGVVMLGMVILFLVVVIRLGLDGKRFAKGLLPIDMPSGSANIVLSLIGTTSIGSNLFLGGAMAEGKSLPEAQRGIAFSTSMALIVSILIMVVGDGTYVDTKGEFTIASLAGIIERLAGEVGLWVFGIGFMAAAISSMLTGPLSAAMTADSVFTIHDALRKTTFSIEAGSVRRVQESSEDETSCENVTERTALKQEEKSIIQTLGNDNATMDNSRPPYRSFPKKYYIGMMAIMVAIAVIVISADAPVVKVILIAQVFNGCLLPFFSICLLICLNDPMFMHKAPQRGWANVLLVVAVVITLFLTCNTIIQNIFGWIVSSGHTTNENFEKIKFSVAIVLSLVMMATLILRTSLGKHVKQSFNKQYEVRESIVEID